MSDIISWIVEELFRGVFEFIGEAFWKKLPRAVKIGCTIILIGLLIAIVAAILWLIASSD